MPKKIGDNKATSIDGTTPTVQIFNNLLKGLQALEIPDQLAPEDSGLARTRTASLPWDPIGCLAFKIVEPAALCGHDYMSDLGLKTPRHQSMATDKMSSPLW